MAQFNAEIFRNQQGINPLKIYADAREIRADRANTERNQLLQQREDELYPLEKQQAEMEADTAKYNNLAAKAPALIAASMQALKITDPVQRGAFEAQAAQQLGIEYDGTPSTDDELINGINTLKGFVKSDPRKFGRVIQGMDKSGKPVFFQADDSSNTKLLEDVRPPLSASEIKKQQLEKEKEDKKTKAQSEIKNIAGSFSQTLLDPDTKRVLGFGADAKKYIGGKLGTNEGVVLRRLERRANAMVLNVAQQLSGAKSDNDIAFLKSTMPDLGDHFNVWADWYESDFIPLMEQRAAENNIDFSSTGIPKKVTASEGETALEVGERLESMGYSDAEIQKILTERGLL